MEYISIVLVCVLYCILYEYIEYRTDRVESIKSKMSISDYTRKIFDYDEQ